jgi:hypothetical protein
MGSQTQANTLQDILKNERAMNGSREVVTVAAGQNLALGAVIGKITKSTPTTGTAAEENTGNGTVTGVTAGAKAKIGTYTLACKNISQGAATVPTTGAADQGNQGGGAVTGVTGGPEVKIGTYTLVCQGATEDPTATFQVIDPDGNMLPPAILGAYTNAQINFTINDGDPNFAVGDKFTIAVTEAAHNSGTFGVIDPDGNSLPDAIVGSAYENAQINFTINDGETDFAGGDSFTVPVSEGAGIVKALDPAAVDGSRDAGGCVFDDYDASEQAVSGVAIVRDAVIVAADLVWPTLDPAITDDQKAAALAQLAARGIVVREEA